MDPIISSIRQELNQNIDEKTKASCQRFFKEEVRHYGVRVSTVHVIAKRHWKLIENREKKEIFQLCEELYQSGICEEGFIVSHWIPNLKDRFEPDDFAVFTRWVDRYITNWATCDSFCNHSIGDFIDLYPAYIQKLKGWTRSENRWVRRAAAVSLIVPARQGRYLEDVLVIADLLLTDEDDMVRKGYGWLLKEASRMHQDVVFRYVMKNKKEMPRTSLRYAIELMPEERRKEAMKKDWK